MSRRCFQVNALPSTNGCLLISHHITGCSNKSFINKSASFSTDTAPIDLHKTNTQTPVPSLARQTPNLGSAVNARFFPFPSFGLCLNKDANPLLWLRSRANRSVTQKLETNILMSGRGLRRLTDKSIIVRRSTAPSETGTESALADSVMQINSKDNTVCSNLFFACARGLRTNACGCTNEGIGTAVCASSPSVGWNILMRSRSICESSATISKKIIRGPKIGRERTAFLDILLCK